MSTIPFCYILIALLLRMDVPHCDVMVHCLIARLLMLENFNQAPATTVDVRRFGHEHPNEMGTTSKITDLKMFED